MAAVFTLTNVPLSILCVPDLSSTRFCAVVIDDMASAMSSKILFIGVDFQGYEYTPISPYVLQLLRHALNHLKYSRAMAHVGSGKLQNAFHVGAVCMGEFTAGLGSVVVDAAEVGFAV